MKFVSLRAIGVVMVSLYFLHAAFTPSDWHFIDAVNLIFHEAGHTIFFFLGHFVQVLMGSGFQVLVPLSITGYFWQTRQKISAAIAGMWAGQSLINVSVYARDALTLELPLLGGDSSMHDWRYLLETTHLLQSTPLVANIMYGLGCATIVLICLVIGYRMSGAGTQPSSTDVASRH